MAYMTDLVITVPKDLADKLLQKGYLEAVVRQVSQKFKEFHKCTVSVADQTQTEITKILNEIMDRQKMSDINISQMNKILKSVNRNTADSVKKLSLLTNEMKMALSHIDNLSNTLKSISQLSYLNIAVSLVNLGVTVYGFMYIKDSLNTVQTKLDHVSMEVSQIKSLMTNELQADFHRLCLNFGTMTTRIKDDDVVSRQEVEALLTEMRVFLQRIIRNFTSGAAADIALDMIFSLLSAFTSLLCYYARNYYFDKKRLPDHITVFSDIYNELLDEQFLLQVEDYLILNKGMSVIQMDEAIKAQELCVLNCMLQYDDQLQLLSIAETKENYTVLEKVFDAQAGAEVRLEYNQ